MVSGFGLDIDEVKVPCDEGHGDGSEAVRDVFGPVGVVSACLYNGASGPSGDGAWVEVW